MMILEQEEDTIAAVSTAPGTGGIAVVRISGSRALIVVKKIAAFLPERPESHRIYFGTIRDEENEPLDEVLISYFARGKSFTGEEVLEISCHGGDWLAHTALDVLLKGGARLARRGEFTARAFLNGRIDLLQAEGVLSLIESKSRGAARAALRQLKGAASQKLETILDSITWVAANLEANIDYAQEDIVVESENSLRQRLDQVLQNVEEILNSENQGRLWNEGFQVALMGPPNVGKSSLLNALLKEDRAIVTEIPGTTRDPVEGTLSIHGVLLRLTDTAGLRETTDRVEKLGIQKSRDVAEAADLILFLYDGTQSREALSELTSLSPEQRDKTSLVRSKLDLKPLSSQSGFENLVREVEVLKNAQDIEWINSLIEKQSLSLSAQSGEGISTLVAFLASQVQSQLSEDAPMSLRARHTELLRRAKKSVERAGLMLKEEASPELTAFELKDAVLALFEILGREFDDQVMDRVFQEFCLGK